MIGEKQNQDVSGGSLAVQAKGDAFVHLGLSTSDLRAIVECMADQLPKYAAIAAVIVEERLKTFEEKVVGKFDAELTQHRQAFADPDFQYLLRSSQQTYARSGDEQTCDNLVNLIAERSKIASRDLISLSLNTAVERAGMLSAEAFAALSYAFFWTKVRQSGKTTIGSVAKHLLQFADPILAEVPRSDLSYSYLESVGCGKMQPLTSVTLPIILVQSYPHLFSNGVPKSDIEARVEDAAFAQSIIDAGILVHVGENLFVSSLGSQDEFITAIKGCGLADEKAKLAWEVVVSRPMANEQIDQLLQSAGFKISPHQEIWDSTALRHFDLTTVGLAIGHANLKRVASFPADLSLWLN